jgi:hypothetical protein
MMFYGPDGLGPIRRLSTIRPCQKVWVETLKTKPLRRRQLTRIPELKFDGCRLALATLTISFPSCARAEVDPSSSNGQRYRLCLD